MDLEDLEGKTIRSIEFQKEVKSDDAASGEWTDGILPITFTDGSVLIVKSKAPVAGWSSTLERTVK